MNQRRADFLNPILAIFDRKIVRLYMGRWRKDWTTGNIVRDKIPMGWHVIRISEQAGLPDDATALDRMTRRNFDHFRDQINGTAPLNKFLEHKKGKS